VKPVVLLDVDGVIADFVQAYMDIVFEVTGRRYDPEKQTVYDIVTACELTPAEHARVQKYTHCTEFCRDDILPYEGAVETVRRIAEIADVYFVTAPFVDHETWVHDRSLWLKRYFGNELGGKAIFTEQKHLVRGDVFVDDKVSNALTWSAECPDGSAIVWDRPYNRAHALPEDIRRFSTWDEVGRAVHK
jgi:5'(3')-deoxyribonucleotidase